MKTFRLLIYMVLDELKLISDDSTYTEDHVLFLLNKYRAFLLKLRYADIKKQIPSSNYQTICLDLEEVSSIEDIPCEGTYMRSTVKIPTTINIGINKVHSTDYFNGDISFVSRERFKYVGHNKWLLNIIYATKGPDDYFYLKSNNPLVYYLEEILFTGIFSDAEEALKLECDSKNSCNTLDKDFPLEDALIPLLIELVVKELSGAIYKPKDADNNTSDDLANLANFLARNTKSALLKLIEG